MSIIYINSFVFFAAALDLQFADTKTLTDQVSGNNLITFTRASTATYVDSSGIIQTAAADAPRFDHDPATGESLGLLIEESRTNLLTYSDYSQVVGTTDAQLEGVAAAPDGTITARRYSVPSVGLDTINKIYYAGTAGKDYTFSVWVRSTGTASEVELTVGDFQFASIVQISTEWQRFKITKINNASNTVRAYVQLLNVGDEIEIWGAQLEEGSFPTSYIPTSGSTVTRAADVAEITGTNFSSWFNPDASTVYFEGNVIAGASGQYPLFAIAQQSGLRAGSIILTRRSNGGGRFTHYDSNDVRDFDLNSALWVDNSYRKLATAIGQSSAAFADSGSLAGTDTTYQRPSASDGLDQLLLGRGVGGGISAYNIHIKRLAYFPTRLPDDDLIELTV